MNKHVGHRSIRRNKVRPRRLGNYLIVTDTKETEKNYFEGLRESLNDEAKENIVIKVINTSTSNLIRMTKEFSSKQPQFNEPWIVFDRDRVVRFDDIIKEAIQGGINVGWSNPCFEIWLAAYFGLMPNWSTSMECCNSFKKMYKKYTGKNYSKNSKTIYNDLLKNGNEAKAIKIASDKLIQAKNKSSLPSNQFPATTVFELVKEIRNKVDN